MNTILLAPHHDITEFCSVDESRYVLTGVHYHAAKKRLEASDGRMVISVPVLESNGEYPEPSTQQKEPPKDCVIPGRKLQEALEKIPPRVALSILKCAQLDTIEREGKASRVLLSTTDLDAEYVVRSKVIEYDFPDIDKATKLEEPPKFRIALSPNLLKKIADYAYQHASDKNRTLTIECWDTMQPVRMTLHVGEDQQEATVHLMPMRL